MWRSLLGLLVLGVLVGCDTNDRPSTDDASLRNDTTRPAKVTTLKEARQGFKTQLKPGQGEKEPVLEPPSHLFHTVQYDAPVGKLSAYVTPDPKDGKKHPAIIWITGGDCNSIGEVWDDMPESNDQNATAYRNAGIVLMFPSLRGGNENPGVKESFLSEVDDVIAAADYLAKQSYVDVGRIYLGGHSTGGTLALLVAECSERFRAVFSFGPVEDIRGYGPDSQPFDTSNPREVKLRSPGYWLDSIRSPTFVFEGITESNISSLRTMAQSSTNPKAHFFEVDGATHFTILAPTNELIAEKILRDDGPTCGLTFTPEELRKPFRK